MKSEKDNYKVQTEIKCCWTCDYSIQNYEDLLCKKNKENKELIQELGICNKYKRGVVI